MDKKEDTFNSLYEIRNKHEHWWNQQFSGLSILFMRFYTNLYIYQIGIYSFQFSLWDSRIRERRRVKSNALLSILFMRFVSSVLSSSCTLLNFQFSLWDSLMRYTPHENEKIFQFSLWDSYSHDYDSWKKYENFQFSLWDSQGGIQEFY